MVWVQVLLGAHVIILLNQIVHGCRYQYVQEPTLEMYCHSQQLMIQIGCSIVYPTDASTNVNLLFFDGDTRLTQDSQRQRKRINETHRLLTRTISVVRSLTSTQYHCFPRLNRTIFLMPSQALDTSTSSRLSSCVSEADIFSTYTTRCADLQVPDGADANITSTTAINAASCSTAVDAACTSTAIDAASSITSECLSTPSTISGTTSHLPPVYSVILPIVSLLLVIGAQSIVILGLCCRHKKIHIAKESTSQLNVSDSSSINSTPMTNVRYSTQSYLIPRTGDSDKKVPLTPAQYVNVMEVTTPSEQDYDEIMSTSSPPDIPLPQGYTHLVKGQLDNPHLYM